MEISKQHIEFLGVEIRKGKIELQPHISKRILELPDKLEELKQLKSFLRTVNYARSFIKILSTLTRTLYNKITLKVIRKFNQEDIKVFQKIKRLVQNLPPLSIPLELDYLIIEIDRSKFGWGGTLLKKAKPIISKKRRTTL